MICKPVEVINQYIKPIWGGGLWGRVCRLFPHLLCFSWSPQQRAPLLSAFAAQIWGCGGRRDGCSIHATGELVRTNGTRVLLFRLAPRTSPKTAAWKEVILKPVGKRQGGALDQRILCLRSISKAEQALSKWDQVSIHVIGCDYC